MGFRFRKSIKVAPGVRLNLGKKSASVSVGGKGFKKTYSTTGRKTTTIGIPGSGLSYTTTSGQKKKTANNEKIHVEQLTPEEKIALIPPEQYKYYNVTGILTLFLSILLIVMSILLLLVNIVIGIIGIVFGLFLFIVGRNQRKIAKIKQQEHNTISNEKEG